MDAYDLIKQMCDYLAALDRFAWFGTGWYLFSDPRSGTPGDRWSRDAEVWRMTRGEI
jgi:hypothetical protein